MTLYLKSKLWATQRSEMKHSWQLSWKAQLWGRNHSSLPSFLPSSLPPSLPASLPPSLPPSIQFDDSFSDMLGLRFLWYIQREMTNGYKIATTALWWGSVQQGSEVQASWEFTPGQATLSPLLRKRGRNLQRLDSLPQSHNQEGGKPRYIFFFFFLKDFLIYLFIYLFIFGCVETQVYF